MISPWRIRSALFLNIIENLDTMIPLDQFEDPVAAGIDERLVRADRNDGQHASLPFIVKIHLRDRDVEPLPDLRFQTREHKPFFFERGACGDEEIYR
jgi:hypothetical protein